MNFAPISRAVRSELPARIVAATQTIRGRLWIGSLVVVALLVIAGAGDEYDVGIVLLEVRDERLEILGALADRVGAHDLTLEAAHERIGQATAVGVVLVENGRAAAAVAHRKACDRQAIHGIAGDDAKGPG